MKDGSIIVGSNDLPDWKEKLVRWGKFLRHIRYSLAVIPSKSQ